MLSDVLRNSKTGTLASQNNIQYIQLNLWPSIGGVFPNLKEELQFPVMLNPPQMPPFWKFGTHAAVPAILTQQRPSAHLNICDTLKCVTSISVLSFHMCWKPQQMWRCATDLWWVLKPCLTSVLVWNLAERHQRHQGGKHHSCLIEREGSAALQNIL